MARLFVTDSMLKRHDPSDRCAYAVRSKDWPILIKALITMISLNMQGYDSDNVSLRLPYDAYMFSFQLQDAFVRNVINEKNDLLFDLHASIITAITK